MQKIINQLKVNIREELYLSMKTTISWVVWVFSIIFGMYLIFSQSKIILYYLYIIIAILGTLLHVLVIKNLNIKFNDVDNVTNISVTNFLTFLFKILFLQSRIWLLTSWLLANLLAQGTLNIKFNHVSNNLLPENDFIILINGLANWVVFVSLLLGIGFFKYRFQFSNIRIAKCLLPKARQKLSIFFYNSLLGLESYIRIISFIILIIVLLAGLFEIMAAKYKLFSFFNYPMITSFVIFIGYSYYRKKIETMIDFFCKKNSMDFISVFSIMFLTCSVAIFFVNQLLLSQIEFLQVIPTNISTIKNFLVTRLFNDPIINKNHIKILFICLNVILTFGATTDVFLTQISGYKIWVVYVASCFFPVIYSVICYNFDFSAIFNNFLTTNFANYLMLLVIIAIFKANYNNIYHILCVFGLKTSITNKIPQAIKMDFSLVIKAILLLSFICLSGYYVFSWTLIENAAALAALLILPVIAMLIIKILFFTNKLTVSS